METVTKLDLLLMGYVLVNTFIAGAWYGSAKGTNEGVYYKIGYIIIGLLFGIIIHILATIVSLFGAQGPLRIKITKQTIVFGRHNLFFRESFIDKNGVQRNIFKEEFIAKNYKIRKVLSMYLLSPKKAK